MPARPTTSPLGHPSSSFGHSTPALSRHSHSGVSSSSPPTDVIATPSDRHDLSGRSSKYGKPQPRRSVRIRTASGGGTSSNPDSSPQLHHLSASGSFLGVNDADLPPMHELPPIPMPARARAVRTAQAGSGYPSSSMGQQRPPLSSQPSAESLALAQAHGLTVDQFEDAKQQVIRFLRNDGDAGSAGANAHAAPGANAYQRVPVQHGAGPTPLSFKPYQQALARTPTSSSPSSSALQSAIDLSNPFNRPPHGQSARARPSFDDVVHRSAKRQKRDPSTSMATTAAVRQWAQDESSSSSSSSDEDGAQGLASMLTAHRRAGPAPAAAHAAARSPGLLPSPANLAESSPSAAAPGNARGMMDRYMSDRPSHAAAAPEAAVPPPSAAEQVEAQDAQAHAPAQRTSPMLAPQVPASPVRKPLSYPAHALLSPVPSRPKAGVLFSPDVARLLRSELDELEMAERKSQSPRKQVDRSSDIVVDDSFPSSPYQRSPFSSGGASRSRDIFSSSQEQTSAKRARWASSLAGDANGPASPTPSLRAPSFCDSSPALSDHASIASRSHAHLLTGVDVSHPASAPDFLYGGIPSSSPTSSHHSEYLPARYSRSSPGVSLARHDTSTSAADSVASTSRVKRGPLPSRSNGGPPYGQGDPLTKPAYSYAALIGQALFSDEALDGYKMALADIYTWIMRMYPYFKKTDSGWQNSIRHNLSLNPCFIKTARGPDNPGKGCLWAIKPGTEDQFVDGEFVRKAGQPSTRRNRNKKGSQSDSPVKAEPSSAPTPTAVSNALLPPPASLNFGRQSSPSVASTRGESPAPSVASSRPSTKRQTSRAFSPAYSAVSARSLTPALVSPAMATPPPLPSVINVVEQPPTPELTYDFSAVPAVQRPATAAGLERYDSAPQLSAQPMMLRSHSSMGFTEQPHEPMADIPVDLEVVPDVADEDEVKPAISAPPVIRTMSMPVFPTTRPAAAPASPPPSRYVVPASHLHEPLLSATMSPPTSVYHRLAGPYQPLSYGGPSAHVSHRALALLASPEAGGIMPGRPDAALLSIPASPSPRRGPTSGDFLPSAHIFPGAGPAGRRQRTDSEKGMLSPTALMHTQSPISSVRGGPRQPMSPVQNASEKLEAFPDPEKKRSFGTRHNPAVNALATSSDALFDPFRSPPPSTAALVTATGGRAHLRSPSARLQAALSTPGGTKGRVPLGFSPSLAGGGWGAHVHSHSHNGGGALGAHVHGHSALGHPASSSRSGWNDPYAAEAHLTDGPVKFEWPSTPGMGMGAW
ncbi:hypothetical protein JCM10207_007657 [Rhodosporidiobolus poonsookiae]